MGSALDVHRLHFAFTVTYHYLFPQLTTRLLPAHCHPQDNGIAHRR